MTTLTITPVAGALGAEVEGVDLRTVDDATLEGIYAALLEYEVLFFRETSLDDEAQLALAARLGEPAIFPMMKALGATTPTIQAIEDGPDSPPRTTNWHTDVTWCAEPPKMALLRATVVPERGGDTMWGSMTAAYEALSPTFRERFASLRVLHDPSSFLDGALEKLGPEKFEELGLARKLGDLYPPVEHPLIRTHPETGARAIFFGGEFMREIVGLHPSESQALLDFLQRHVDDARFHVRWRWRVGDLAIWDERSTIHRAVGDHFPQRRTVRRCEVAGDRPFFDGHVEGPRSGA